MDPNNPVVKLCAAGMEAEGAGRMADAATLFAQAWEAAQDDYEAGIAAHYVARHQPGAAQTLHWNQVALDRAKQVRDGRAVTFLPSLYLNLGNSYEIVGDLAAARACYTAAQTRLAALSDDGYSNWVRAGVTRALARTQGHTVAEPRE